VKPSLRFNALRRDGAPHSSVSIRLRWQSPNLEDSIVFDDKCIALSNNVLANNVFGQQRFVQIMRRPQQDAATALATVR
jgi:hypothetical protein